VLETIAEFLKPFYDITTSFSGSNYPTANLYFSAVWRIQMKLKEVACVYHDVSVNQDQICCMAKSMKTKFQVLIETMYCDLYQVLLNHTKGHYLPWLQLSSQSYFLQHGDGEFCH
jgi:hypothetical protein